MTILSKIFGPKVAVDPKDLPPPTFIDKWDAFKKVLAATGKAMPSRYSSTDPYICNFGEPYTSGNKKWVRVRKNSMHLTYYETDVGGATGLYVMHIDRTNECFRFNKIDEVDDANVAIDRFVDEIGRYADRGFMRILQEKMAENYVLSYGREEILDTESAAEADSEQVDKGALAKSKPQNLII